MSNSNFKIPHYKKNRLIDIPPLDYYCYDREYEVTEKKEAISKASTIFDKWGVVAYNVTFSESDQLRTTFPELLETIKKYYYIRNVYEIISYLFENPFLINLIIDSYHSIKHFFENSTLFIDKFVDPESVNNEHLIIQIKTQLSADKAFDRLMLMHDHWWLNKIDEARGMLTINIEF